VADRPGEPDPLVVAAVIDIAGVLAGSGSIGTWCSANVFVPDVSQRARLGPVEQDILDELDTLIDVCLRPHDRLDQNDELVRIDAVRRVPPAGLARLAAHTEDWAGVEHGRIRPLRLLSRRFVEDLDFYENRVVAQLVDRLIEHLNRRIRELTTLAEGLEDLGDYHRALKNQRNWRRSDRAANLVASALTDETALTLATLETAGKLTRARSRLRAIFGSPVLRRCNRRARVPMRLRRTNLFVDDRRYRRIGALWELWAVHQTDMAAQLQDSERQFPAAYAHYIAVLSVRALAILGYEPVDPQAEPPARGEPLRLTGPAGEVTWIFGEDGEIQVLAGGRAHARIVPAVEDFGSLAVDPVRLAWLAELPATTIVAHPGRRALRTSLPPAQQQLTHPVGFGARPPVVPINPLEIEGEERLGRALRWNLQGRRFISEYPPIVHLPTGVQRTADAWWRPGDRNSIALLRRPGPAEVSALATLAAGRGRGARRPDDVLAASTVAMIQSAAAAFDLVETCPVCRNKPAVLKARDRDTFQSECGNCASGWGVRICRSCTERYPVLWLRNAVPDATDGDRLDVTAGADVLAIPCSDTSLMPGTRFRCPWCHHCAGQPGCGCPVE